MTTYFKNIQTLEDLRKQYKELLKKFHPDNANGSTQSTQEINAEYDRLFKVLKDRHESKSESANTNTYDFTADQALREVLQKIIIFDGLNIEIIGSWIWVNGNTYQYKAILKEYGFKWASSKKMWYFHNDNYVKKSRKKLSIDDIWNYYGSTTVDTESQKKLAFA